MKMMDEIFGKVVIHEIHTYTALLLPGLFLTYSFLDSLFCFLSTSLDLLYIFSLLIYSFSIWHISERLIPLLTVLFYKCCMTFKAVGNKPLLTIHVVHLA